MKSSANHPVVFEKIRSLQVIILPTLLLVCFNFSSCGVYSFTGGNTEAKTISITEFYNNADLGPANMGPSFTNDLKTYFIQNSSLDVVPEEGELQFEGEIQDYKLTPIAPVSTGNPDDINNASSTRLTITIKATYVNTLDETMSFENKTFSFYKDFPNDQDFADIQEQLTKQIFDRIINDIFNASIANW
ncbi:MAG TPA: LptE family protein [Chryseolinea sp.]|nr:LptE family protein [Chryseolinea sp.]HPH46837.1 LptE family protein [Chryseolinea sp.]HPM32382.1 LptE family protein [Chryseolinea sp.]